MAETYKSVGTRFDSTTGPSTIYGGVASGSAIVNAVVFSNVNPYSSCDVTLEVVKGVTAYSLITNAYLPIRSSLQALDAPIVLEANDTIRASPSITGTAHVFVSVVEQS